MSGAFVEDDYEIISILTCDSAKNVAIIVLIKGTVLHFMQAETHGFESLMPQKELVSFQFYSREKAIEFSKKLPGMTAFELMLLLNNDANSAPTQ